MLHYAIQHLYPMGQQCQSTHYSVVLCVYFFTVSAATTYVDLKTTCDTSVCQYMTYLLQRRKT